MEANTAAFVKKRADRRRRLLGQKLCRCNRDIASHLSEACLAICNCTQAGAEPKEHATEPEKREEKNPTSALSRTWWDPISESKKPGP